MKRIFSGITPSGQPHIGNYFGMMKPLIDSQTPDNLVYFFISDQHAFTTKRPREDFIRNRDNAILDWLALGADPEKSIFFLQSSVPAHTELAWYLSCTAGMGLLERAHAFKDKTAKGLEANVGLFTYPILMAADILLYDLDCIPVGKDQKQHIEMARDIGEKFNATYGPVFPLTFEAAIDENVMTIPGTDGAKMSKSYGNTLEIFSDEKTLRKKVMSIQTGSEPLGASLNPDTCIVMQLHTILGNPDIQSLRDSYVAGTIGYGHAKQALFEYIWEYFRVAREKRAELEKDPGFITQILTQGAEKAHSYADKKLHEVRKALGIES
jgi:tryptophanyl-tRNA synthetase